MIINSTTLAPVPTATAERREVLAARHLAVHASFFGFT